MAKKLRLTGRDSFSSPLTFGIGLLRNQVILVDDATGAKLQALMNREADPDVAVFTLLAGAEVVNFDLTKGVPASPQPDGSVVIDPSRVSLLPYRIPKGVQLRGVDLIPYGWSDGAGGYTANAKALASADGNGTTPQDRLIRATDDGAILLPRAHPNYHCHFFAGDYFADANRVSDRSGQENHAVLMSALTGAVAGANAGYISTAAALNQMWEIPDPNFDLGAGESVLFHWMVNMPRAAASVAIYGNGNGASAGLRLLVDAGTQDNLAVLVYNSAGVAHSGGTSIPNGNTAALDGALKSISVYVDASNPADKRLHAWVNGALARNNTAITLAGSTASNSRPRVGGSQSSTTGTVITKTRALAIFKWAAGETVPTQAQVTTAINRLIAQPGQLLLDGDL